MTTPQQAYQELRKISKEIALLHSLGGLLSWDQEAYMPRKGADLRAEQTSYVQGQIHRKFTDPKVGDLLSLAEADGLHDDPFSDEGANLREWRHDYDRAVKVPTELVEELASVTCTAQVIWAEARKKSDFSLFQPYLEQILALVRRQVEYVGYEETPYDALLDEYEAGETTANVERLFSGLRKELVPLVQAIQDSPRRPNAGILTRSFPVERQKLFGQMGSIAYGFDFQGGRLDTVTHPFCLGVGPGDVRITTRYTETFFNESYFGVLHETGHGLYEQGLPAEHFGEPLGEAVGMGIHESQSRLWENLVGRSRPYWRGFFPRLQQMFPEALADVAMEEFYFAVNEVKPSFIRVEADEVTYNLHIMLRFELEQALVKGDLPVADVPGAWNERFKAYVGLDVPNDSQGCLQDVHWSFGGFGYFPSYALGNLYAAQIFAAARQALPDLDDQIGAGQFQPLLDWLTANIYRHGRRYRTRDLLARITGEEPSYEPLMAYLRAKFGELYAL